MPQPHDIAQDMHEVEAPERHRLKPPIRPDIPRAKREGLTLRLDDICRSDPDSLSAQDHYRLKTSGPEHPQLLAEQEDPRTSPRGFPGPPDASWPILSCGASETTVGEVTRRSRRYCLLPIL